MKALRIIAALVLLAGACVTARAAYLHTKAELAGILIHRAWTDMLHTGHSRPPWPWADIRPVAHLRIPRLGYDEMVLEGATPRTLAFGPARMFSGARLGEPGNLLLAGHRTSWFRSLETISRGDTIQIEWLDSDRGLRKVSYTVDVIQVVQPQDVRLLGPTDEDALTLITCYPFGRSPRSPQRFVVRAYPAGTNIARHEYLRTFETAKR